MERMTFAALALALYAAGAVAPSAAAQGREADKGRAEEFGVVLDTAHGRVSVVSEARKVGTVMAEGGDQVRNIFGLDLRVIDMYVPLAWGRGDVKAASVTPPDQARKFVVVAIEEQHLANNEAHLPGGKVLRDHKVFSVVAVERRVELPVPKTRPSTQGKQK